MINLDISNEQISSLIQNSFTILPLQSLSCMRLFVRSVFYSFWFLLCVHILMENIPNFARLRFWFFNIFKF